MDRISFDEYFMKMAFLASERSTCERRRVGAVLVRDRHVIATGYNGAAMGVKHCGEKGGCIRQQLGIESGKQLDICSAVHAEQNVIAQAAYHGIATKDSILYVTISPCFTCAKLLINAGVKEVVINGYYPDDRTEALFEEAKIKIRKIEIKQK